MKDEVDDIVAAWQQARPDLDVAPMQVLSRVRRLAQLLDTGRDEAFAEHGLAAHEFDVLAALRRQGDPDGLTPGQLADATHVTSGTMTNRLDRLQARRLISRGMHPDDRRQSLIRLTASGRRRVDGALVGLLQFEAALLADLKPAAVSVTIETLRRLLSSAGQVGTH